MQTLMALVILAANRSPTAEMAGYSPSGGVRERDCCKEVDREEYIPGTRERPGRVRRWTETKRIPCGNRGGGRRTQVPTYNPPDENSCIEGSILGGIAGAGAGAALSRAEGRWIGIQLGIVGGTLIGWQIDGG